MQLKTACEQGRKAGAGSALLSVAFSPLLEQNMKGDDRYFSANELFPILILKLDFLTMHEINAVDKKTPAEKSPWSSSIFFCFLSYSVNSCYFLEAQAKPDIGPKPN